MHRISIILFILSSFFSYSSAGESFDNGPAVIYGGVVNVREKADVKSKKVHQLKIGDGIEITNKSEKKEKVGIHNDYWYEVHTADKKTGYVYGSYISIYSEDIGDGRKLLFGASDKKKGFYEFRILQDEKITASKDFKIIGFSEVEEALNYFDKFEIHKDFFGKGHHVIELRSFAGIEAGGMFAAGAYLFSINGKDVTPISEGQSGADAPVYSQYIYEFKQGVITEIFENLEAQDDGTTTGDGEKKTFKLVNGKIKASKVQKYKIKRKEQ